VNLSFQEACSRYQNFLTANGYPSQIVWVTPENILATGSRTLLVKMPVPSENLGRVREIYDAAIKNQTGVSFSTVCEMDDVTCCRVWAPLDESERQHAQCPRDLKLSALTGENRLRANKITNRWLWAYLRFKHRKQMQVIKDFFWG
jgi:hypothetical protein